MKTLIRTIAVSTLALAALTAQNVTPAAHAAPPNLKDYRFQIDSNDDRWMIWYNYSVVPGFGGNPTVSYNKLSPYLLDILTQDAAGNFTGRLTYVSANTWKSVVGSMSQSFGQGIGGTTGITFRTLDNHLTFTGNARPSPNYGTYFMAGSFIVRGFSGNIAFLSGPNPFAASGYKVVVPR